MLNRLARGWLLVVIVLSWGTVTRRAYAQFFSPGDLARAHAELDSDDQCGECHSAGRRVDDAKCGSCHEDVALTVRKRTGLHGRKFAGKSCGGCHVDHRGREHELIRWDPQTFEHQDAGWALNGAHAPLDCKKCHDRKNSRGAPTYLGLNPSCTSCHEEPHEQRFGTDCLSCHDEVRWKNVDLNDFDHDKARFALRGKHQDVACAACHGEPAKYQPLDFAGCGSCHEDPHRGRFGNECQSCHSEKSWKQLHMKRSAHPGLSLFGGHAKAACKACHDQGNLKPPSRGNRCASCHEPVHEAAFGNDCKACHASIRWLGLPVAVGRRAHSKTTFPLKGKHRKVKCSSCHSEELKPQQRFRELSYEVCKDCHADPHKGQFQDRNAGECGPCHDENGFSPTQFGVELHASTSFALTGGHEATPCSSCHEAGTPRLSWQVTKQECASCHDNPHGDQFAPEMARGGCAECHTAAAWDIPNIAHETWPLTGAHARASCDQCHSPSEQDRKAGGGASYRGAPRDCEGCHEDIHLGQFRLSDPVRPCQDCHTTTTFKLTDFDHEAQARYALVGKHAQVECGKCHEPARLSDNEETVLWRLPYDECRDCHANPHDGAAGNAADGESDEESL